MAEVSVAGFQMDVELGDVEKNLEKMERMLSRTSEVQLAVFPECAVSGYCFETRDHARQVSQTIPGPATDSLQRLAKEFDCHIACGMLEHDQNRLFNSCVVLNADEIVVVYRKVHLPTLGVDRFVEAGSVAPPVVDLGFARIGIHICYDASFPESTRLLMLGGADLAILPTNWPSDASCFATHLAPVRAMENHLYFMVVNRVGHEGGFDFLGSSQLVDPFGNSLASANDTHETTIVSSIDPDVARQKEIDRDLGHSIHRWNDRRPDLYQPLSQTVERWK